VLPETPIPKLSPRTAEGPAVTIVMPTFRRAHAVGETLRSLLDGEWTDFELLVRDDGDGTDGTEQAVAAAADGDPRVRYHRNETNLRMPGNLNAGIMESRGEFIAVCHDHDLYKPSFIKTMVETLRRNRSALFVHCAIETISQSGESTESFVGDWPESMPGADWLKFMLQSLNCPVCALTVVRREAHERYGLYDPACGFISDVEMWMRLSSHGDVAYVREPLICVRAREDNHTETINGGKWISTAAKIHRRFLSTTYNSPEHALKRLMLEGRFLRQYLRHHATRLFHRVQARSIT
jgi:glycosyltransferase involved in cell wall biosynthesis